jgi:hypothetical protein
MINITPLRQKLYLALRLIVLLFLSVLLANYLNQKNYNDFFNKTLLKLHTDTKISAKAENLPQKIEFLMLHNDAVNLQKLLDGNYALFGLVITDCKSEKKECPGQRALYSTDPKLIPDIDIIPNDLPEHPFTVLRKPSPELLRNLGRPAPGIQQLLAMQRGDIIGRLYSISTIPASFAADYRMWRKHPFRDSGPWKDYRRTMGTCLLAGFLVWVAIELFLKIRRIERLSATQRERVLIANADKYMRQLEEKGSQIGEQEQRFDRQFAFYIEKIKTLEQTLRLDVVHQQETEAIIRELEEEKRQQSLKFKEELLKTNQEKSSLRDELERYRTASQKNKEEASRALESVIAPQFGNVFERSVFECISKHAKSRSGDWIVQAHFDVAPGKSSSQFIDSMVISKDCLMVVEAKNYTGIVEAEGDVENTPWHCLINQNRRAEIKSSWGKNPYHQVREYAMNLMRLVQRRSNWTMSVYGVVVFPAGADLTRLGERLGKYYRVTTVDHLVRVLENIQNEAHRENPFAKRPSPRQVEDVILGRSG